MNALFQRLKELAPATFEELCFQIWSERLPTAGLRHVEGTGGDKGTDLFAGTLAGRPAIWQCKFFKDGIKDAQKKQVKKSLRSALKNFRPALWTLCVPVKLTINAHHWFQEQTLALLRKLDPETSISTPVPPASFIAVRSIHIPRNLYPHARNPYPHPPGILIHIAPESVSTCPGIRSRCRNRPWSRGPGRECS